jgi:hypothetical protein
MRKLNITLHAPLRCTLACLLLAVTQQPQAWPQSLTTEYVRAGGRLIAVVHKPPVVFTDVSGQLGDEADLLSVDGISGGTSCGGTPPTYCPSSPLTRDQMAVLIVDSVYVALQGPGQGGTFTYNPTPYFTDVPANFWAFKFIQKMYELGITAGASCPPAVSPSYCPAVKTTNAQMAVFTTASMQYVLHNNTSYPFYSPPLPQYFPDVNSSTWGYPFIQYLASLGVIPVGGSFNPGSTITRGLSAPYLVRGILGDPGY